MEVYFPRNCPCFSGLIDGNAGPAWEKAVRQGESELDAADSGLKKLVRRVIPGLGNSGTPTAVIVNEETTPQRE